MDSWIIGIDLGATKTALGLLNPENDLISRRRILTIAEHGPQAVVERIVSSVRELESDLPATKRIIRNIKSL